MNFADYKRVPVIGRLRTCVELAQRENLKGKVVVDVGCSNGLLAYHLVEFAPKEYIGIDPSESAINKAQKELKKVKFEVGKASKLPVKNSHADVVLMFDVIEHVPKYSEVKTLKEIHRVLKKKGILLLSTPNNNFLTNILDPAWYFGHRHYKPQEIIKHLRKSGFEVKSVDVRGGIWFSIYLLWLYVMKWIFTEPMPRNRFLEKLDDEQFKSRGIHTLFVVAEKG